MDRHRSDGAGGNGGGYLSYADLEERYGKSRVTLWRWVRAGLLPAPYELGPNSVGFSSSEIQERDSNLTRRAYGPAS
jgi:predicted DNA-binding transcriptional regulator AlpA